MMPSERYRRWGYAVLTLGVFSIGYHLIPRAVNLFPDLVGYPRGLVVKTLQIALAVAALLLTLRTGLRRALAELGLAASFGRALAVALVATTPMVVAFAITGTVRSEYSLVIFIVTALFSPIGEEILFRGYAFGQLYRRARWSFWPAILIPTVFFSLGHLYQADSMIDAAGIFGVTAIGSVWFAWLYLRWGNLWIPICLHALMNLWWYVFEVDTGALGGWLANVARVLTIVISVVLTVYRDRIWGAGTIDELSVDSPEVQVVASAPTAPDGGTAEHLHRPAHG